MNREERAVTLREYIVAFQGVNAKLQLLHPENIGPMFAVVLKRQVDLLTGEVIAHIEKAIFRSRGR